MKALLSRTAGGPETLVLEEVPDLTPGPGQALVAVRACGVNYPDVLIIEDRYQFKPQRPFAPGGEVAGVVTALGQDARGVAVGDRVFGSAISGGMAEQIVVPAESLFKIPPSMDFDQASAFLMTYGTSYYALNDRGRLKAGETLLVLGAAGGVGLAAVELGKALGARVIAAASSEEKVALAKAHGADDGVVYPTGSLDKEAAKALTERFKAACGKSGADVIYDAVGGDYAEAALRAIAWAGRFLVVGFPAGIPKIPLNLPLLKSCDIAGVFWGAAIERDPQGHRRNIATLTRLYEAGRIKPFVSERFPLARGGEAIAHLGGRKAMGKVVVTMG